MRSIECVCVTYSTDTHTHTHTHTVQYSPTVCTLLERLPLLPHDSRAHDHTSTLLHLVTLAEGVECRGSTQIRRQYCVYHTLYAGTAHKSFVYQHHIQDRKGQRG